MNSSSTLILTIIVHYESPQDCIRLVNDLLRINCQKHKIIVVDNHSKDNTFRILKQQLNRKDVILIQNLINGGYGSGINFAVNSCKKLKAKFIHIINPDTKILNFNYLSEVIRNFQNTDDAAIIGPAVKTDNIKIQNTIMPFVSLKNIFFFKKQYKHLSFIENHPKLYPVNVLNGVCFIVKMEAFSKVNGFDEDFFMYGEEHDLCYRLYKLGYKCYFWSGPSIKHKKGAHFRNKEYTWRDALIRSNQVLFLQKHKSILESIIASLMFSIALFIKKLKGIKFKEIGFFQSLKALYFPRTINDLMKNS